MKGHAIAASDSADLPDAPLERGSLLLIARDRVAALEALVGAPDLEGPEARYASFRIDQAQIETSGAAALAIDTAGEFDFGTRRGSYLVCLANIRPDAAPGPPYFVSGCAPLLLTDRVPPTVRFGEGGVEARPAPGPDPARAPGPRRSGD